MATYSAIVLDEIRAGIDIVDLVGRFVNLKKAGVNWKGLCPFHGEKTPSFYVVPDKKMFHCFGCGASGGATGPGAAAGTRATRAVASATR